jgi:hypothetical protein
MNNAPPRARALPVLAHEQWPGVGEGARGRTEGAPPRSCSPASLLPAEVGTKFGTTWAEVCGYLSGNLTRGEWDAYAPGIPFRTTCP